MLDVEGFILVGGESSRMGQDKSRLLIKGQTTVSLISEALSPLTPSVRVVGSKSESDALPNVPDIQIGWGPLGGIQAALRVCRTETCIIVACDLPFVTPELFTHLLKVAVTSGADAIVPLQQDGRPQPLCAVYRREPCLTAAEESVANNQHSPRALLDLVKPLYLGFDELARLPGADYFFLNLNRQEDYELARRIATGIGPT